MYIKRRELILMEATLTKWGNSIGIRIPSQMAADTGLHSGARVEIYSRHKEIIIRPKYDIKDMYEKYYNKPLSQITAEDVGRCYEADWGEDVGAEVVD